MQEQDYIYVPVPKTWAQAIYARLGELASEPNHAGPPSAATSAEAAVADATGAILDEELIARMYNESYEPHKELMRFLAERPGKWFYTGELGEQLGSEHGAKTIAGMLGAFGRRAAHRYGGQKPWRSEWDAGEGSSRHTMDEDVAAVIRQLG